MDPARLNITHRADSRVKNVIMRVKGRFQDTTPISPESANEKPAQEGQECLIFRDGVMVAATKLDVMMRTPNVTWTKPRASRICDQVRCTRMWERLREVLAVSERLESVGDGMAFHKGVRKSHHR